MRGLRVVWLCLACACSSSRPSGGSAGTGAQAPAPDAMAGADASGVDRQALQGQGEEPPEPVECGGTVCAEVPALVAVEGGQPCCQQGTCGVQIVGNPTFTEICIPLNEDSAPNRDCPSPFDRDLSAFRYGCCLPNNTCGEAPLLGPMPVGCADLTLVGFPQGAPCDPTHTCGRYLAPCASAAECCPFSDAGPLCGEFEGAAGSCTLRCSEDLECPSHCCRQTLDGVRACAPLEVCEG